MSDRDSMAAQWLKQHGKPVDRAGKQSGGDLSEHSDSAFPVDEDSSSQVASETTPGDQIDLAFYHIFQEMQDLQQRVARLESILSGN